MKREKQRLRRGRVRGDHKIPADEGREQGHGFRWLTLGYGRERLGSQRDTDGWRKESLCYYHQH